MLTVSIIGVEELFKICEQKGKLEREILAARTRLDGDIDGTLDAQYMQELNYFRLCLKADRLLQHLAGGP